MADRVDCRVYTQIARLRWQQRFLLPFSVYGERSMQWLRCCCGSTLQCRRYACVQVVAFLMPCQWKRRSALHRPKKRRGMKSIRIWIRLSNDAWVELRLDRGCIMIVCRWDIIEFVVGYHRIRRVAVHMIGLAEKRVDMNIEAATRKK